MESKRERGKKRKRRKKKGEAKMKRRASAGEKVGERDKERSCKLELVALF